MGGAGGNFTKHQTRTETHSFCTGLGSASKGQPKPTNNPDLYMLTRLNILRTINSFERAGTDKQNVNFILMIPGHL